MKQHVCLKKQCNSFAKQNTHDFGRQHEQKRLGVDLQNG